MEVIGISTQVRRVYQCDFCHLEFETFPEKNEHILSHFQREICEDCDQNIILIGENWYVLHATITCVKKCIKSEPTDETDLPNSPSYAVSDVGANVIESVNDDQSQNKIVHVSFGDNRLPIKNIKVEPNESGTQEHEEEFQTNLDGHDSDLNLDLENYEYGNIEDGHRNIVLQELDIKSEMTEGNAETEIQDETIGIPKDHSESDALQCSQCMKTFFSKHVLQAHIIRSHDTLPKRRLKCIDCDTTFATQSELNQHQHGRIICIKCSERFCSFSFSSHQERCLLGQFWCKFCKKSFQSKNLLHDHDREFHATKSVDVPLLETNISFQMFGGDKVRLNLSQDNNSETPTVNRSKYDHSYSKNNGDIVLLNLIQNTNSETLTAKRRREDDFPIVLKPVSNFRCQHCYKIFSDKRLVDYHPCFKFSCKMCGRKFCSDYERDLHHKTYRIDCETCDRKFCSIDQLRFHRKYCLPNRPKCEFCSLTFSSKPSLRGHIQRVHNSIIKSTEVSAHQSETNESNATIASAEINPPQEKQTETGTDDDHSNINAPDNFTSSSEPQCDNI